MQIWPTQEMIAKMFKMITFWPIFTNASKFFLFFKMTMHSCLFLSCCTLLTHPFLTTLWTLQQNIFLWCLFVLNYSFVLSSTCIVSYVSCFCFVKIILWSIFAFVKLLLTSWRIFFYSLLHNWRCLPLSSNGICLSFFCVITR